MSRLTSTVAILVGLLLMPAPARAGQATCSNPGLPVGASATGDLLPWRLTMGLTTSLLPGRSSEVLAEAQGDILYDASFDVLETRLTAALALRSWLGVAIALPYRAVAVGVTYRDPATGDEIVPTPNTIHARDETLHGLGDPTVMVQLAREIGAYRLHARIGTSLPLGGTVDDPFLLGQIGQDHQHVQFGTGTLVPFVAIEAQRRIGTVTAAAWALLGASLDENRHGYLAGDRYSAGSPRRRAWARRRGPSAPPPRSTPRPPSAGAAWSTPTRATPAGSTSSPASPPPGAPPARWRSPPTSRRRCTRASTATCSTTTSCSASA